MRTTYTKPNSISQKTATQSVLFTKELCAKIGISRDEWIELLFECGCAYAEAVCRTPEEAHELLTNAKGNFWNVWLAEYIIDDKVLVSGTYPPKSYAEYKTLKENYS